MNKPEGHPKVAAPRIGVLLINLGTPDAPDPRSVKRYLGEFLSDRRVIEIPALVWQPILRGVILRVRPRKSAHAYSQIWREDGSPLAAITRAQAEGLKGEFGEEVIVDYAMRYGNPAIGDRIEALRARGCDRILLAPLYPQYSAATTATANDAAFARLERMRWQPAIRTLPAYHDDAAYITALKQSIERQLATLDFKPERLVVTFHGMPRRTLDLGDPYHCHCQKTARLLGEALGQEVTIAFQSRFGPAEWLGPATDKVLEQLGQEGIRKIAIVAPGFSADCLETLEEIAIRGRESFIEAGGTDFAYLECLNDSHEGMELLRHLVRRELDGWLIQR